MVLPSGGKADRVDWIFDGVNLHGKDDRERSVFVKTEYLPYDCIEVFWEGRALKPAEVRGFTELFRKAWKLPPPSEPELAIGEVSEPPKPVPLPKQAETPAIPPVKAEPLPPPEAFSLSKWLSHEFGQALNSLRQQPPAPDPAAKPEPLAKPPAQEAPKKADDQAASMLERVQPKEPALPPIDPRLFEIQNPRQFEWDDFDGLVNFGSADNDADVWRIRDASEGAVIFGAVGSGKTSGSGAAIARAFLQAGFGGLVLTAKPDEARRWLRMCQETGRIEDCVHVTPGSGHKLNILQYETQRPGKRIAVTDDLIALFRCLIGVMTRSKRGEIRDDFWSNSTNQLMRMLFDIFLLAGESLSMNRLVRFINLAPKKPTGEWRAIPFFGNVLVRAEENAQKGTDEDRRIFEEAFDYWTRAFPEITNATRSGIITGFTAMANTVTGRGIHEMIGTETNLTPEMILSGKIVIMDIPVKENVQGGLMVQAAWKLLFQQAIERRADKGLNSARPVFLWEDEGHLFFSQHDVDFQPTARDCRAAHVILSQNIHNFLQQGHNAHAIYAVFSAINTHIFHTNGDFDTNQWAAQRIGQLKKLKLTTDGLLRPLTAKDISIFERPPEETRNVGHFSLEKETKNAVEPEDFMRLKRGGDGTCEAIILWLSHQFAVNRNRNFCFLTFEQEKRIQKPKL